MMPFTDEELIEQLRDGDSAVMDFLMEKYKYLVRKKGQMLSFYLAGILMIWCRKE